MATLYQLTDEYTALLDEYDAAEDDARRAEILALIDQVQDDIGDKAEAYARIMKNLQAEAEAYKAEAQRLGRKQKAAEGAVEGLKRRLMDAMRAVQATEIRTSIGKWRVQLNPPSCKVIEPDRVPGEYHIPQPDAIDRQGILRRYKETGEIPEGVDITREEGLRFR